MGNKFSVIALNAGLAFRFRSQYFAGVGIDVASYSARVSEIPGISGSIDTGAKAGIDLFTGIVFDRWRLQAGYSTCLGLNAAAGYRF